MSPAIHEVLASPVSTPSFPRPLVAADGDTRPIFVDESGRRARWCRRLLGACTLVALGFVLMVAVLGLAFTRSTGCDAWAGPDQLGQPTAVSTATAPVRLSSAPGCRP